MFIEDKSENVSMIDKQTRILHRHQMLDRVASSRRLRLTSIPEIWNKIKIQVKQDLNDNTWNCRALGKTLLYITHIQAFILVTILTWAVIVNVRLVSYKRPFTLNGILV